MNISHQIQSLLQSQNIPFKHILHEEVKTSEEAATVRGTKLEEGRKALIVKGKKSNQNYMFVIPANARFSFKKASVEVGEKLELEDPKVILEKYELQIGSIPPFGNLLNISTYFDSTTLDQEDVAFNCGLRTESIIMKAKDLVDAVQPNIIDCIE